MFFMKCWLPHWLMDFGLQCVEEVVFGTKARIP